MAQRFLASREFKDWSNKGSFRSEKGEMVISYLRIIISFVHAFLFLKSMIYVVHGLYDSLSENLTWIFTLPQSNIDKPGRVELQGDGLHNLWRVLWL